MDYFLKVNKNILTYGVSEYADYRISNIRYKIGYTIFDLSYKSLEKKKGRFIRKRSKDSSIYSNFIIS